MKIRNSLILILGIVISISACIQSTDCNNCENNSKIIWSYKLRWPFGMDLNEGEIVTQNSNLSKIVIIDNKTGKIKQQLPTTYDNRGEGAVVGWCVNKRFIVYEQVLDYKKSFIKIYNRAEGQFNDSIPISLKSDLSRSHGIVKLFGNPIIVGTSVLFVLNDGTLNSYNILKKKIDWNYNLQSLPLPNSTIITIGNNVHIQQPGYRASGLEVITISKAAGKFMWKTHFPSEMPLSRVNDRLLDIDKEGNLAYINSTTGQIDKYPFVDKKPVYYQIVDNKWIFLFTENNVLIVKNFDDRAIYFKCRLCAEPLEINYSKKMKAFFLVDKAQHCIQIDLNNFHPKCIQQFVDNTHYQHNFIIREDSLYLNKGGELCLFQLK